MRELGLTIAPSVQEGLQNLATVFLLLIVTVGTDKQEAKCPNPESFPTKKPDS